MFESRSFSQMLILVGSSSQWLQDDILVVVLRDASSWPAAIIRMGSAASTFRGTEGLRGR